MAAQTLKAGFVDEINQFIVPAAVGDGHPALPDDWYARLEPLDKRRFGSGVVHLHYGICKNH